ncbi:hypothetical protein L209DRAFT_534598 [Thermothelomyces heterothallicus CBS 203.75]
MYVTSYVQYTVCSADGQHTCTYKSVHTTTTTTTHRRVRLDEAGNAEKGGRSPENWTTRRRPSSLWRSKDRDGRPAVNADKGMYIHGWLSHRAPATTDCARVCTTNYTTASRHTMRSEWRAGTRRLVTGDWKLGARPRRRARQVCLSTLASPVSFFVIILLILFCLTASGSSIPSPGCRATPLPPTTLKSACVAELLCYVIDTHMYIYVSMYVQLQL